MPVIQDADFDATSAVSLSLRNRDLVANIEDRLRAKMIETGYLPESTV